MYDVRFPDVLSAIKSADILCSARASGVLGARTNLESSPPGHTSAQHDPCCSKHGSLESISSSYQIFADRWRLVHKLLESTIMTEWVNVSYRERGRRTADWTGSSFKFVCSDEITEMQSRIQRTCWDDSSIITAGAHHQSVALVSRHWCTRRES